ncbi:MAG: methionine--tRNA ligase [Pseudomonadota bacterium]
MRSIYVTTPIYYVNDKPHIGHAYTSIAADALCRWHRRCGDDVWMLTGTDEHGQKVLRSAALRGISPQAHCDELSEHFRALLRLVGVQNDDFIRTTEPRHTRVVQAVLQHLYDRGDIYAADYEGWYSTAAERFWTEKDLIDGKCPDTGQAVEWVTEKNWFFKMGAYADQLRAWIDENPGFLAPASRKSEVVGALRKEIGDLCISRPKERMSWGIELPFDPDYVTYVWFDALLNYLSAVGYHPDPAQRSPDFDRRWPAAFHLVGKDILATHSIYWSTMLFALGLPPARCLYAHGWWMVEGRKMSKSLGNVVDPTMLVRAYGAEQLRYFLLREIPFGGDGDFSHQAFFNRTNADLANDLGNLAHRALSMSEKWLGGVVPALDADTEADLALGALAAKVGEGFGPLFEAAQFSKALELLWELVSAGNKYIDSQAPWALNKSGQVARLGGVLRRSLEICRIAAALLAPILPSKSQELADKLGLPENPLQRVGSLDGLIDGAPLRCGEPLFPRLLELPAEVTAALSAALAEAPPEPAPKPKKSPKTPTSAPMSETTAAPAAEATPAAGPALIEYDDFAKIALRTGLVKDAARHPKADRLLVLTIDLGEAQPRTIVAGLAQTYAPEVLVGQTVVVVANLKPIKLRGVESHGMVLAVGGDAGVQALATASAPVAPGTVVR